MTNSPKYKNTNVESVFGDIKRILGFYSKNWSCELTSELATLLIDSKAYESMKIVVDFLRSLNPNSKYLYIPSQSEFERFVVKTYDETIKTSKALKDNSLGFRNIFNLSTTFTEMKWLGGPQAYFWVLYSEPFGFIDVVYLCRLLTKKRIKDPEIALLYSVA